MPADRDRIARELLTFYQEAGADALLGEAPVDRLADAQAPAPTSLTSAPVSEAGERSGQGGGSFQLKTAAAPRASSQAPALTPDKGGATMNMLGSDTAVMAAREAAKNAASLDDLRAILDRFEGCALRRTASRLVFADGNPQARVMFVGEAPGRDEDIEGLPFVGRSGKLLDRMLAAIGLDRTSAYIANIIPWRPPGNRDPTPQETVICLPFIKRQIELANPDVLVCLGKPSAQTLLDMKDGILKNRGRWFPFHTGTREIRALVTLHPAYLLRQPLQKRLAWRDFLAIKKSLSTS